MQESKLTPEQIASMSEVIAVYHNKYTTNSKIWVEKDADNIKYVSEYEYHSSWDWLHEVWDKVRNDERFKNTILYDPIVPLMAWGTKEQVFTELHNIINKLKQK
jgi:hypothetical protein